MSAKLHKLFHAQGGRCFYCGRDTYLHGAGETKDQARARFGIRAGSHKAGTALRRRHATLEHLVRKIDGGGNVMENLAMACMGCNVCRGETPVEDHKRAMIVRATQA